MVGESIAPEPTPDVDTTMRTIRVAVPAAGANIDPLNYVAQSYVYDVESKAKALPPKPVTNGNGTESADDKRKREEAAVYRKLKQTKPKMNLKKKVIMGLDTKIIPGIPNVNIGSINFIHGKPSKVIKHGIDLNKITESFKTPSIVIGITGSKQKSMSKVIVKSPKINLNILGKKKKVR